ncbi:unnamed protein product [Protopolystoma xenopodis]|uniref:Uncharacterized protein n=1 Tax=Protopolystoma xenopodis TaxID=117903 RepID=A0A3S5CCY1_9PLAT|nr:unnamed protein product [Protopolystoma xenopodis]
MTEIFTVQSSSFFEKLNVKEMAVATVEKPNLRNGVSSWQVILRATGEQTSQLQKSFGQSPITLPCSDQYSLTDEVSRHDFGSFYGLPVECMARGEQTDHLIYSSSFIQTEDFELFSKSQQTDDPIMLNAQLQTLYESSQLSKPSQTEHIKTIKEGFNFFDICTAVVSVQNIPKQENKSIMKEPLSAEISYDEARQFQTDDTQMQTVCNKEVSTQVELKLCFVGVQANLELNAMPKDIKSLAPVTLTLKDVSSCAASTLTVQDGSSAYAILKNSVQVSFSEDTDICLVVDEGTMSTPEIRHRRCQTEWRSIVSGLEKASQWESPTEESAKKIEKLHAVRPIILKSCMPIETPSQVELTTIFADAWTTMRTEARVEEPVDSLSNESRAKVSMNLADTETDRHSLQYSSHEEDSIETGSSSEIGIQASKRSKNKGTNVKPSIREQASDPHNWEFRGVATQTLSTGAIYSLGSEYDKLGEIVSDINQNQGSQKSGDKEIHLQELRKKYIVTTWHGQIMDTVSQETQVEAFLGLKSVRCQAKADMVMIAVSTEPPAIFSQEQQTKNLRHDAEIECKPIDSTTDGFTAYLSEIVEQGVQVPESEAIVEQQESDTDTKPEYEWFPDTGTNTWGIQLKVANETFTQTYLPSIGRSITFSEPTLIRNERVANASAWLVRPYKHRAIQFVHEPEQNDVACGEEFSPGIVFIEKTIIDMKERLLEHFRFSDYLTCHQKGVIRETASQVDHNLLKVSDKNLYTNLLMPIPEYLAELTPEEVSELHQQLPSKFTFEVYLRDRDEGYLVEQSSQARTSVLSQSIEVIPEVNYRCFSDLRSYELAKSKERVHEASAQTYTDETKELTDFNVQIGQPDEEPSIYEVYINRQNDGFLRELGCMAETELPTLADVGIEVDLPLIEDEESSELSLPLSFPASSQSDKYESYLLRYQAGQIQEVELDTEDIKSLFSVPVATKQVNIEASCQTELKGYSETSFGMRATALRSYDLDGYFYGLNMSEVVERCTQTVEEERVILFSEPISDDADGQKRHVLMADPPVTTYFSSRQEIICEIGTQTADKDLEEFDDWYMEDNKMSSSTETEGLVATWSSDSHDVEAQTEVLVADSLLDPEVQSTMWISHELKEAFAVGMEVLNCDPRHKWSGSIRRYGRELNSIECQTEIDSGLEFVRTISSRSTTPGFLTCKEMEMQTEPIDPEYLQLELSRYEKDSLEEYIEFQSELQPAASTFLPEMLATQGAPQYLQYQDLQAAEANREYESTIQNIFLL